MLDILFQCLRGATSRRVNSQLTCIMEITNQIFGGIQIRWTAGLCEENGETLFLSANTGQSQDKDNKT